MIALNAQTVMLLEIRSMLNESMLANTRRLIKEHENNHLRNLEDETYQVQHADNQDHS